MVERCIAHSIWPFSHTSCKPSRHICQTGNANDENYNEVPQGHIVMSRTEASYRDPDTPWKCNLRREEPQGHEQVMPREIIRSGYTGPRLNPKDP